MREVRERTWGLFMPMITDDAVSFPGLSFFLFGFIAFLFFILCGRWGVYFIVIFFYLYLKSGLFYIDGNLSKRLTKEDNINIRRTPPL